MTIDRRDDRGMSTAEHAVGTLGACGLAAVLYRLGTDGYWLDQLAEIIRAALSWRNVLDLVPTMGSR